mgnify:FL=1
MNYFLEKLKNLKNKKFVQDVFTLQLGAIFSTGLAFLVSVVLARILGANLYGQYSLIFAFAALLCTFTDVGEHYATITMMAESYAKKDATEIKNILTYFLKISLIIFGALGLILIVFSPYISEIMYGDFSLGQASRYVVLATLLTFGFSFYSIVLQVTRRIKNLTIFENINKIVHSLLPILLVLLGFKLWGVIFGNLLSSVIFLAISVIAYSLITKRDSMLPKIIDLFKNFKQISIRKYFNFGFLVSVDKNLAKLYSILPIIFMGYFVGNSAIAQFKIASSYILIPFTLMSPISRLLIVQLPKSKVMGFDYLKKHYYRVTLLSPLILIIVLIPFLFVAPYLVKIFYGSEFAPSVNLIYWLVPQALINSLGVGFGPIYRTINKVKYAIISNLTTLICGSVIGFLAIKNFGVKGGILMLTAFVAISTLFNLYLINKFLKKLTPPQNN